MYLWAYGLSRMYWSPGLVLLPSLVTPLPTNVSRPRRGFVELDGLALQLDWFATDLALHRSGVLLANSAKAASLSLQSWQVSCHVVLGAGLSLTPHTLHQEKKIGVVLFICA